MKLFLVVSLLLMACGSLSHANSCVLQKEETRSGVFKVVSVVDAHARCVKADSSPYQISRRKIKIDGCIVEYKSVASDESIRVYNTGAGCKVESGSVIKAKFQTVKNECCGVSASFGRLKPLCVERPELKFVIEPTDGEKECLTGVEWKRL
ncbi:hypothetical protein ACLVWU_08620 [Bdellovibrio sp. HCB290]|uniref:hypothetical protein n=1 Tax=Bdellovibrio sp. HCB290 TaxID=3394356 RepID=UPI0039B48913